jgi:hypothetical protein
MSAASSPAEALNWLTQHVLLGNVGAVERLLHIHRYHIYHILITIIISLTERNDDESRYRQRLLQHQRYVSRNNERCQRHDNDLLRLRREAQSRCDDLVKRIEETRRQRVEIKETKRRALTVGWTQEQLLAMSREEKSIIDIEDAQLESVKLACDQWTGHHTVASQIEDIIEENKYLSEIIDQMKLKSSSWAISSGTSESKEVLFDVPQT